MKRILFFVHFNKYDGLSKHVLYLLEHIKHIYSRIIIISNSKLNEQQAATLAGLSHSVIERKNTGFDFGAWKETLLQEGWENLEHYDSVTLMNDTCFGPVFDMEQTYKAMEERQYDFWGMTVHPTTRHGMPGNNWAIPEHLQSYFLCFNKKVVASKTFQKFWHKVKNMRKVNYVIQKY